MIFSIHISWALKRVRSLGMRLSYDYIYFRTKYSTNTDQTMYGKVIKYNICCVSSNFIMILIIHVYEFSPPPPPHTHTHTRICSQLTCTLPPRWVYTMSMVMYGSGQRTISMDCLDFQQPSCTMISPLLVLTADIQ